MDLLLIGKFFPHWKICFYTDLLHTVQGHNIKLTDRLIVLRRIACRHNDPACWNLLISKGLTLQKLQHGRRERLRYAVDLVEEQNALAAPRGLHRLIDRGDDLAHGVFGHLVFHAVIGFRRDERQA